MSVAHCMEQHRKYMDIFLIYILCEPIFFKNCDFSMILVKKEALFFVFESMYVEIFELEKKSLSLCLQLSHCKSK